MISNRSYLLKAFYDWISDNELTPYLLIDAEFNEGKITLNISKEAILHLKIDQAAIQFDASFNGESTLVYAPIGAVLAIYARENGQGMVFAEEEGAEDEGDGTPPPPPKVRSGAKPKLSIVK
ncbi:stringent starvation protein B [Rickettsiella massiliensis]|uniref:stringent starvation protein B n=1 Tax=Rickettsiella massiliensis TaxID=676517 RepID=UPI00029A30F1|nr:ClpXP protease specificity-enhancing factor SspB [Rickettsiella massiliensis]